MTRDYGSTDAERGDREAVFRRSALWGTDMQESS